MQPVTTRVREKSLPYALPLIGEEEIAEVVDSLRSGWVTTGPKVKRFEEAFCQYVDTKQAIAVSSCTAALHIALTALGVGPGDEVIVPTMTFCSTANVVVHLGARPVLVDIGADMNVDPAAVEAAITPKTKAIVPVHYAGQACDLAAIYDIANRHDLPVVEDAAHAVGSDYGGHRIGADGLEMLARNVRRVTAFSFYAIKNITTGEGGMITSADEDLAQEMRLLTLHGMSRDAWKRYTSAGSWYYEIVAPGYKNNMTDIQAAMGIHQLAKLDGFVETRQRYAQMYDEAFADLAEIETPLVHGDRLHSYHLYVIQLDLERLKIDRAAFIQQLNVSGIGTSVHFIPVHLHPYYQQELGYKRGDLPRAEQAYDRIISIPLYPKMAPEDVNDVIEIVRQTAIINRR